MPKADSDIKSLDFSYKVSKGEPSTSSGGKSKHTTNLSGYIIIHSFWDYWRLEKGKPVKPGLKMVLFLKLGFWFAVNQRQEVPS